MSLETSVEEFLVVAKRALNERNELVKLGRELTRNDWYSKDPKWWAAVDRRSYERFMDLLALLDMQDDLRDS